MKSLFIIASSIIWLACGTEIQTEETLQKIIYPAADSKKEIELVYDSTTFFEKNNYKDFLNCEIYFSDDEKNVWKFHVYKALSSMHGYKLYDKNECSQYKGARFYIEWDFQGASTKSGEKAKMNRIEELMLLTPEKFLKRKLVKLSPNDDIIEEIYNANAGDSIVLKSGIYYISEGSLGVYADYVTVIGEPGCFIYANIDYNVLDIGAHYVKISNLYLSHLNSENAECSGDVIMINSFSCRNLTIENCDINGCGVVGLDLYAVDKNEGVNYIFRNNFIHNNSGSAIIIGQESFQNEVDKFEGIVFENNKIWNNGVDKINEPFLFKNIFTFGLADSTQNNIKSSCSDVNVYHLDKIEDKEIPFYGNDTNLIIGYINPVEFAAGNQRGVLVYERFKPVKFYTKVPKLCDTLSMTNLKDDMLVVVYSTEEAVDKYFAEGGSGDWTYFSEEVWSYFANDGITVKSEADIPKSQLAALIKKHISHEAQNDYGLGYFFIAGNQSIYCEHDLPEEVKKKGDAFFKKILLKNMGLK